MKNLIRFLYVLGFSVLSGLFGVGVTWLAVAIFYVRNNDERLTKIMPLLFAGGIVGFIVGAVCVMRIAEKNPENELVEKKYLGGDSRRIFAGAPLFVFILLSLTYGEKFLNKFGNTLGAYLGLGILFVILVASIIIRDYIPRRFILPIGIIGWLLTFALFIWFGFFGPGVLK